ncbi:MAG: CDP-glycerol glycerophosphotransferase family protein [Gallionellaceae bacterium]|nr:CDP-glycerol glycerophosphotransferase family protein [Gallionellaceae bacterium]
MKTIAFLPLTRTNWPIMVRLATTVRDSGQGHPVIILSNPLMKSLSRDMGSNIESVEIGEISTPTPHATHDLPPASVVESCLRAGLQGVRRSRMLTPLLSWHKGRAMQRQLCIAESLLRKLQPTAIVVSGDRNTGIEPAILRAARKLEILSIIPPSAFSATLEGLFIARRQNPAHFVTHRADFKRQFPNQWRHDPMSGEDICFFGVATTRAYASLGMLSENPWVLGGGLSDWILVDSTDVKQRYIDLGVDPDKILVTGHPDHDALSQNEQRKAEIRTLLYDKYQLDPARKLILLCLPNWAEVGLKSWEWHWRESEILCRNAVKQDCNVLLSLHPSQERARYIHLEDSFRPLRILDERLAMVMPVADIYLTGLASSTIPWAVLSSVPTVIADHYPEKDRIHAGLPGVLYVPEADQLANTLARLVGDDTYFQALRQRQQESANRYGTIDGHATERIVQALLNSSFRNGGERLAHAA